MSSPSRNSRHEALLTYDLDLTTKSSLSPFPDQLATYFPKVDHKYRLDPEYEPEDEFGNMKEPVNKEKVEIAQLFKSYRDAGLLKPSDPKLQLYWVARRSETVELTPRGREYWWLVVNDKI